MINTFFNFFARSIPMYLLLSKGWHNHLPLPFLCTPHQFCSVGASLPHSHYLGTHSSGRLWVSLQIRADKNTLRVGMLRGGLRESWFSIGFQGWMGFRLPGRKRKRSGKRHGSEGTRQDAGGSQKRWQSMRLWRQQEDPDVDGVRWGQDWATPAPCEREIPHQGTVCN